VLRRKNQYPIGLPDLFGNVPEDFARNDESNCADCGINCVKLGEWYMVHDHVWEQAWAGQKRKPCYQIEALCIGCLEQRLGRPLMRDDFIPDVPINDPNKRQGASERLRNRLVACRARQL
jgi:hypothetical protein